jgi:DNA-directed RNA polymerase subunit K
MANNLNYTKYEKARVIGARALQIAMGAPLLLKLKKALLEQINFSPVGIAKMEFEKGVLPITIKRPLPSKAALPVVEA